jgi:hypothetical protein
MNRRTNVIIFISIMALAFMSCERKADAIQDNKGGSIESYTGTEKSIRVDIFYLPHPPAMAIVKKVEAILKKHPSVKLSEYDFLDPKNAERIKAHGFTEHSPVIILIDDKTSFTIDGKQIEFKNFPKGDAFVPSLEGSWTYEDIEKAIASE